jgi:hypothetical protein
VSSSILNNTFFTGNRIISNIESIYLFLEYTSSVIKASLLSNRRVYKIALEALGSVSYIKA